MAVATVANFTQTGTELSFAVQLPDGSFQRYTVSLLESDILTAMAAKVNVTAAPTNDALIKANLQKVTKGLQLTVADPVVVADPVLPQAERDFIRDFQIQKRYTSPAGVRPKGYDVAGSAASLQTRLDANPVWEKYIF